MLLFVCDLSHSLDKGKQIVITVITANTAFPPGLSQVTAYKVSSGVETGGGGGVEWGEKKMDKIAFFSESPNQPEHKHTKSPCAHIYTQTHTYNPEP